MQNSTRKQILLAIVALVIALVVSVALRMLGLLSGPAVVS